MGYRFTCVLIVVLLFINLVNAWAETIHCSEGDRVTVDLNQVALQYDTASFTSTLSQLSAQEVRISKAPLRLVEDAVATQQWSDLLTGLTQRYNSCAVTSEQYADVLDHIYPDLKQDSTKIDAIRKAVLRDPQADTEGLGTLLDSYWNSLSQFAQASGKQIILKRIEALSARLADDRVPDLEKENRILTRLDLIEEVNTKAPLALPAEVAQEISEEVKQRRAKVTNSRTPSGPTPSGVDSFALEVAETDYESGYKQLDQYRFVEAIPQLQKAIADFPLPDFHLALGRAYEGLSDFDHAEETLKRELERIVQKDDATHETKLANLLGLVLMEKGDLDGALAYTEHALAGIEKVNGPEDSCAAVLADRAGQILQDKGDLDHALTYALRALEIDEKVYGPDNPNVATFLDNIGAILLDKGDLDGALAYTQRALAIDEKNYGPVHRHVAIRVNNLGEIFRERGDLDGALAYTQRALAIDEKVLGPLHPNVAGIAGNIGDILNMKGDFEGALAYSQRALTIDETVYGPDHPSVATRLNNLGDILRERGDLESALSYTQRALAIDEKVLGPSNPKVAVIASNVGGILRAKGDFEGAVAYSQRALTIDEHAYGPDHPSVARDLDKIARILTTKGDLDEALTYSRRALAIDEHVYGPDHPSVAIVVKDIGLILEQKGDLQGAFACMARAMKIFVEHYGIDNPRTIVIANNLKRIEQERTAKQPQP